MNEDEARKPAYSEFNSIKAREESMTQEDRQIRIDFPPPLACDGERRRGTCRLAISHQLPQKRT
jgi:hypothetical protein